MAIEQRNDEPDEGRGHVIEPGPGSDGRTRVSGTADLVRSPADSPEANEFEPEPAAAGELTTGSSGDPAARATPLLPTEREERFRTSWEAVQVGFVDQPRQSVEQADQLVAELMQELAQGFAQARSTLEAEWDRGEDISTEELRLALQRYRSFFQRLLAA